jgi:hypothetical protein
MYENEFMNWVITGDIKNVENKYSDAIINYKKQTVIAALETKSIPMLFENNGDKLFIDYDKLYFSRTLVSTLNSKPANVIYVKNTQEIQVTIKSIIASFTHLGMQVLITLECPLCKIFKHDIYSSKFKNSEVHKLMNQQLNKTCLCYKNTLIDISGPSKYKYIEIYQYFILDSQPVFLIQTLHTPIIRHIRK